MRKTKFEQSKLCIVFFNITEDGSPIWLMDFEVIELAVGRDQR